MSTRWWCLSLVLLFGCLFLSSIGTDEVDYESEEAEEEPPEYRVDMAVDIKPKAAVSPPTERPTTTTTIMERLMTTVVAPVESTTEAPFTCYGCIDCHLKSDRTVDVCPVEIRSCYSAKKRIKNKDQIVRRGCSTSTDRCTVPDDGEVQSESITCCDRPQCNRSIHLQPSLVFLFILLFPIIRLRHI